MDSQPGGLRRAGGVAKHAPASQCRHGCGHRSLQLRTQLALVARSLSLVPERILKRSRLRSRLRALRISGLDFPLTIWMVDRQPFVGLDRVIAELGRVLSERLC
jgi:hypothetical protein